MIENVIIDQTLRKNCIEQFILRIDIIQDDSIDIGNVLAEISKSFDRLEKKSVQNYMINFTQDKLDTEKIETFDYVWVSDNELTLTYSQSQNAFIFIIINYMNSEIYKKYLSLLITTLHDKKINITAKRIGMRFVNSFKCSKKLDIAKIYGKRLTTIVNAMMNNSNPTRLIGVEEKKFGDDSIRLQYGITNKFYPAEISVIDLLLDIDSYIEDSITVDLWESTTSRLNHLAYNEFIREINPKYLGELK